MDFTKGTPADPLTPELGQTFLVYAPLEATRLYLGFADGYLYQDPLAGTTTTPVTSRSRLTSRRAEVVRKRGRTMPRLSARVDVDAVVTDAERVESVALGGEILLLC